MKRFVTYLFRYANGEKGKNAGHIRIRMQNQMLRMQINIKDFELKKETGVCYIIAKQKQVYGIPLGTCSVLNGQYQGEIFCNCQEKNLLLQEIAGVGISFSNDVYMASCWDEQKEEMVADGSFLRLSKKEGVEEPLQEQEPLLEACEAAEEPSFLTEISYQKINLNEIHRLSSEQWHLSNNSFLLHGFWNYGYLVLKEKMEENETKLSLGIPGIFEEPEKIMAAYFGFPDFEALPPELEEAELGTPWICEEEKENQQPQNGVFGCWFVSIS